MPQPYKLFTIYAREDAQYLEELRGQLRPLEHAGRIKVWSDREINPGVDWEKEIVQNLDTADIILILVSAAYYNSAYIHEKEIKYAINRHERGEAKVLPVIVRPCSFGDDPVISRLQVLPTDGKPVTDRRHWQERDDAWLDVVAGVKRTIEIILNAENQRERDVREAAERERLALEKQKIEEEKALLLEEQRIRMESLRKKHEEEDRQKEEQRTREEQTRREQEEAYRRADLDAWQQAADANLLPAYENYLAQYPQGEYAREARARIKELKRENAAPPPWGRYAAIGGGALILLLAVWLLLKMFSSSDSQLPESSQLSESSPTRKSGLEMVQVQGGTFTMGSPTSEAGRYDDGCQHPVTVGSFSIGKYEVTQAAWREIMGSDPSYNKGCNDCPVEQVSWNEVQDFIKALNKKTGKTYRLPTEEEWEYAARGGKSTSSTTQLYAGSNNLGDVAWFSENSNSKTHPVGGKSPNELGLYDMTGNVWEWCSDTYKPYPCDSKNTASGSRRVLRGGSWLGPPQGCRVAARDNAGPETLGNDIGFRLAASSF